MGTVLIQQNQSNGLEYFKLNETVQDLEFGTAQSACFDLRANLIPGQSVKMYTVFNKEHIAKVSDSGEIKITHGDRVLIPTGIIFKIPEHYSLRIHPRSSVAIKLGLTLPNCEGVIDSDYFHETFISLQNTSEMTVIIKNGERLAQAELVPVARYSITETKIQPTQTTDRVGGFGSTGK